MSKKLTKHGRKRLVKLLTAAQKWITDGKSSFICCALNDVAWDIPIRQTSRVNPAWDDVNYLCKWINDMLGEDRLLETWLIRNKFVSDSDLQNMSKRKSTRLRWMDWMIKELKEGR